MAPKITVIGTGYLGATHAAAMAELGFEVLGLDVVPEKIEMLSRAEVPMYEPGLEELLGKHVAGLAGSSGRLRFTTSWEEVAEFGDVHFVCVNTPQKHGEYACDMSYVDAAVASLAPLLHRPALVVGKSTVPVGSAARLARMIAELAPAGAEVELAWNRSSCARLRRRGHLHPDRIVVGVPGAARAEKCCVEVYPRRPGRRGLCRFVVTDYPTAETGQDRRELLLATRSPSSTPCRRSARRRTATWPCWRRPSARRADREEVLRPGSASAAAACAKGHPRLHGAGGRARRRPGLDLPPRGPTPSTCAAAANGGAGAGDRGRQLLGSVAGAGATLQRRS
ncbi:hypothetical protein GCM10020221_10780 [Streptomyces thioluteus]|uniref:UDP-glucose/GDP-mannose dehydrogenase N-terminal domain-containing protein n=1 Tax=Streptomyces thioluteus TaxID=66431 RepID=A0ABN3WHV7_STRTU